MPKPVSEIIYEHTESCEPIATPIAESHGDAVIEQLVGFVDDWQQGRTALKGQRARGLPAPDRADGEVLLRRRRKEQRI